MKIFKTIFIFIQLFFFININANAIQNKILVKIENNIITSVDIKNEIKILKLINKNLDNIKKDKIFKVAKESLIKDKIQEIELLKYHKELTLPVKFYKPYMERYINKLGFQNEIEFKKYAKNNQINLDIIEKKIIIELLWNQLVYKKFFKNVKINKELIKKNILKKEYQNEYQLSEIVFSISNKNDLKSKLEIVKRDIELKSFEYAALTHGISESSSSGGELGWIKEAALSKEIKTILKKVKINNYTTPIQIPGGFIILKVNNIRKIKNNLNLEDEVKNAIVIKTNQQLSQFSNIYINKIKKNIEINEL